MKKKRIWNKNDLSYWNHSFLFLSNVFGHQELNFYYLLTNWLRKNKKEKEKKKYSKYTLIIQIEFANIVIFLFKNPIFLDKEERTLLNNFRNTKDSIDLLNLFMKILKTKNEDPYYLLYCTKKIEFNSI